MKSVQRQFTSPIVIVPEVILLRRSGSGEKVGEELEIKEDELVEITKEVGEELVVEKGCVN